MYQNNVPVSYDPRGPAAEHSTFPPGGLLTRPTTRYKQQQSNDAAVFTRANEETPGIFERAERQGYHSPRNEGGREDCTELPRHPTRLPRPRSRDKAKKAMHPRKRRRRRKSCDPTAPVSCFGRNMRAVTKRKLL
jgi:hypothetical protein